MTRPSLSTLLKTSFGFGSLLILLATATVIIGAIAP